MHCPKCSSEKKVKNGFMKGAQRYRCKQCRCNYTRCDSHGRPTAQKILAVALHLSGMSMNSVGVIIGVSVQSVMRWIRWAADLFGPLPEPEGTVIQIEMDEIPHFLLKKVKNSGKGMEEGKCWIIEPGGSLPGILAIVAKPQAPGP